jgi:multidrug efflux pump subunit AcrA (membrane-fusion protein)
MKLSEYLKPALGVAFFVVLGAGYYWFEHRSQPEEKETPGKALVIVTKSTNACFSDMVRVTGFIVPRREAQVGVDQEGSKVTDLFVHEGDMVTENQELARLTPPPQQQGGGARPTSISLRAPGPGLVTEVRTAVGAPSIHLLKLNPGATVRISRDDAPDLVGKVRQISPQVDRTTQLGHVRISLTNNPSLKVGMFARANIDAKRSCGVAVPRTAIDRLTLQVVKGNVVETRKVRVGLTSDTSTEILEGLDVGETVVADAGSSLHDGDQIKTMFADELDRTRTR